MRPSATALALSLFCVHGYAFQLPFTIPFLSNTPQNPLSTAFLPVAAPPNKVAIIGAGAGGSSAAFWIAKAKERFGLDVEVDVFERNDYIGGRSTVVYPYNDTELEPIELGASIFVRINKNLWRATEEFGLERISFGDDGDVMGLWDGKDVILTTGGGYGGWWDTLKIIWRYGLQAPRRTEALVKTMADKFLYLYGSSAPRFDNLTGLADTLDWTPVIAQTAAEYLEAQGVDRRFTHELVDAATRVNYGQNVDSIHALEGLCSLAATDASSVKGGNFRIFEEFLRRSNASVHLNTNVLSLSHDEASGAWLLSTSMTRSALAYRAVIVAAPLHSSSLALAPETLLAPVPEQPYVHLHVTLLSTPSPTPNATYFGLGAGKAPTEMLTTYQGVRQGTTEEPEFNSMTYHGKVQRATGENWEGADGDEWVVKIFSKKRISDEWLANMFGKVGWVLRKEWDAYPVLPPTTSFPPVKLAKGLYYVNAFEPFISTMETETISARNIVDLLLRDEFNAAICPQKAEDAEETPLTESADFVLGWDC